MEIPYADYGKMHDPLRAELDAAYRRVMDREWFIQGEEDRAFESAFASFSGARHCIGVGNGLDALALAEQMKPDVALCDVRMPKMNGIELARRLRLRFPAIHIL